MPLFNEEIVGTVNFDATIDRFNSVMTMLSRSTGNSWESSRGESLCFEDGTTLDLRTARKWFVWIPQERDVSEIHTRHRGDAAIWAWEIGFNNLVLDFVDCCTLSIWQCMPIGDSFLEFCDVIIEAMRTDYDNRLLGGREE